MDMNDAKADVERIKAEVNRDKNWVQLHPGTTLALFAIVVVVAVLVIAFK